MGLAGALNPAWKGGRILASTGYVLLRRPGHPRADKRGYIPEHRLIAEEMLGRPLDRDEVVHHRNGVKTDNRWENLEVLPSAGAHARTHGRRPDLRKSGEENPTILCACGCGDTLLKFDSEGRPRRFIYRHQSRKRGRAGRFD